MHDTDFAAREESGAEPRSDKARPLVSRAAGESTVNDGVRALGLWARSGAMWLTGKPGGPPSPRPAGLALAADSAMGALRGLAGPAWRGCALDAPALLAEHAAATGGHRRGTVSANGAARLVATRDGHLAVNLARADDVRSLAAWLERPIGNDYWQDVERAAQARNTAELVERGRLLGLPLAASVAAPVFLGQDRPAASWFRIDRETACDPVPEFAARSSARPPRVVDFSALWAGPLATHLLALAGADVIKVEDRRRPDGARHGSTAFYNLLNAGKRSVALDFSASEDRRVLRRLVESADIVVEASRPRALRELGLNAERLVEIRPHLTWVSITGYGRRHPQADWVAFGDDAATAAGLASLAGTEAAPVFCADAVADPLTGVHAALAALSFHRKGGGVLLDIALTEVAAHAGASVAPPRARVSGFDDDWTLEVAGVGEPVARPRLRSCDGTARPLGADTAEVLSEFANC